MRVGFDDPRAPKGAHARDFSSALVSNVRRDFANRLFAGSTDDVSSVIDLGVRRSVTNADDQQMCFGPANDLDG